MTDQATSTYLPFKSAVARALAAPPYNWVGGSSYRLMEPYEEAIASWWENGWTPNFVAETVHHMYMDRPVTPANLPKIGDGHV